MYGTFGDDAKALKAELLSAISGSVDRFYTKTGISPSSITVQFMETRSFEDLGNRYTVQDIKVEFRV